jgi:hypothetical protein
MEADGANTAKFPEDADDPQHPAAELRPNPLYLKITEWPTPLVFLNASYAVA